jgi:septal ring factor EnvC (AmiA/AmiB activator)
MSIASHSPLPQKKLIKKIVTILNRIPMVFQEIMMVNTENQLTRARLHVEHQKGMNEQTSILLEELKKQVESKANDLKSVESDLHHSMLEVKKKQGALDSLQKKLEELTSKSGVGIGQRNRAYSMEACKHIHLIFHNFTWYIRYLNILLVVSCTLYIQLLAGL